ncbi:hypothetical protein K3555_08700 [Leisingera sp. M527]|uniref:hypothetical protein n=1 Tax=unclassified Leisingera TaxID=2614906 RepID=UPI0021A5FA47|nr:MULTISPECIES: hypothetical protein [unclassified Leisingera]UWQ30448.1 hypothetical protein K3557_07930 [Leisingera sp. M523]UWQ34544.1 hypothetical protein K3555_08700 [Leisingera sp. M527]UWQ76552.1 hypothetical protein K3724_09035 [Leisingera sp. M658]
MRSTAPAAFYASFESKAALHKGRAAITFECYVRAIKARVAGIADSDFNFMTRIALYGVMVAALVYGFAPLF